MAIKCHNAGGRSSRSKSQYTIIYTVVLSEFHVQYIGVLGIIIIIIIARLRVQGGLQVAP